MSKSVLLFDLMTKRYGQQPIADQAAYEGKLTLNTQVLYVRLRGLRVQLRQRLHRAAACSLREVHPATIYTRIMITKTNERKSEESITKVDFAVAGIHALDTTTRQYGVVLGPSTLQLTEYIDAANASIFAMLRPGSYFISSRVCMPPPGT